MQRLNKLSLSVRIARIKGRKYLFRRSYVLVQNIHCNYQIRNKIVRVFYKVFIMIWISCNNY